MSVFLGTTVRWNCGGCSPVSQAGFLVKSPSSHWTHWAFTKNVETGQMKIYMNGTLVFTSVDHYDSINTNQWLSLRLGENQQSGWTGVVDEFAIFSRELSSNEIALYYRGFSGSGRRHYGRSGGHPRAGGMGSFTGTGRNSPHPTSSTGRNVGKYSSSTARLIGGGDHDTRPRPGDGDHDRRRGGHDGRGGNGDDLDGRGGNGEHDNRRSERSHAKKGNAIGPIIGGIVLLIFVIIMIVRCCRNSSNNNNNNNNNNNFNNQLPIQSYPYLPYVQLQPANSGQQQYNPNIQVVRPAQYAPYQPNLVI